MAKPQESKTKQTSKTVVAHNRRARFDYAIELEVEAGISLYGTEVKALRAGHVTLDQSWARLENGEAWLIDVNIAEHPGAAWNNHPPKRKRKLLLHKRELAKLEALLESGEKTLVPLDLHFSERGFAKVLLGVGTGRKKYDKRTVIGEREAAREIGRAMRRH